MITIIKGGLVVTGADEKDNGFIGDVIIVDEKIAAVTTDPAVTSGYKADRVIDARGKIVVPGGIDPHVHLEYPQGCHHVVSCDNFYTGSVAALSGGTTTILDFIEANNAEHETLMAALKARCDSATKQSVVDFSFHMTLNRSDSHTLEDEVPQVIKAGISSFKIYTAYDGIRLTDSQLIPAFKSLAKFGGLPIVHCECHDLIMARLAECRENNWIDPKYQPFTRPVQGESEATHRIAMLAEAAEVPAGVHIVHVTAEKALPTIVNSVKLSKPANMGPVTGEVCAHHLVLTDDVYNQGYEKSADFVCAPPMRNISDVNAMWDALINGSILFTVTDHCPFTRQQRRGLRRTPEFRKKWDAEGLHIEYSANSESKETAEYEKWFRPQNENECLPFYGMPGGVAGLENRVLLTYHYGVVERGMGLGRFAEVIAGGAAKRYNMWPQKGNLMAGADGDVTIIDPNGETVFEAEKLHQNCDHCPFEGMKVKGKIDTVLARGTVLVENGVFLGGVEHHGVFIPRKPYV